jgi:hypothetical protein
MTLAAGTRVGPYEILSLLGAGGMGEVYRAKDTRLAREVAIKVLPESLSSDQERLRRFEKEARSASALNHPNIVTIHDIGSIDSVSYIAMELVDGGTLRELLASGSLPIKRLLQIAPQIAEGLARAHEAGIIHRDLKPENVMVKKDGLVKILDFGLAKLSSTGSGSDEASQLPTMTGTQPGVVVGTVSYMSPEQASGAPIDFRSDQFSLGSMLYEMATAKRAFQKKTAIDTLAAILNEEPKPIASIAPQAPAPLRWIVERCLAKEPRQRYASTEDLARDLATVRDHSSELSSGALAATVSTGARSRRFAVLILGAIAAAIALVAVGLLSDRLLISRAVRTEIPSIRQLTFRRGNMAGARFAPDGRTVVYAANWDGGPYEIYTVRTDSRESRPIGIQHANVLAVSSKGELAILNDTGLASTRRTLARVPIGGGTPRELLEHVAGADWAPNGEDLAVVQFSPNGKLQIQYPIGTVLAEGPDIDSNIRISPAGDLIAFTDKDAIVVIDGKKNRRVISRGWKGIGAFVWSPRGDELILAGARSEGKWAIHAVSLSGRERVLLPLAMDLFLNDVASDGRLLVERGIVRSDMACQARGDTRERELAWLDASVAQDISEDGKLVLFSAGEEGEIFLRRSDGSPAFRLGRGDALELSADGRWALAVSNGSPKELVLIPTGTGTAKRIPVEGVEPLEAWLLPNEKGFIVRGQSKDGSPFLVSVGADGGKATPVRVEGYSVDGGIVVSPAGDRFVYVTKERQLKLVPLSGGEAAPVPGAPLDLVEKPVQWSADGLFLYVARWGDVDWLELATGRRKPWKRLAPADQIGFAPPQLSGVHVSRDGLSYVYNYNRVITSDLFIVEGVR